jgi:hypothetical protein
MTELENAQTLDRLARPAIDRSLVDRWIYVAMAALFLVTAVVGFAPRSVEILTGVRRTPPLVVHIHAALIVAWLGMLLTQTTLVAVGKTAWHKTLGLTSLVLAPAVVAAMVAVSIWRFDERVSLGQVAAGANTLLNQGRAILYFSVFFLWAILSRKADCETHKRMMILTIVPATTAAFARMPWLPTTTPDSPLAPHAYMLLLLAPVIIYDVVRLGRPHSAYLIGLALMLPWMIATELLWNSPWWAATASRLMGASI